MGFSLQGLWNDVTGRLQPAAPPRPAAVSAQPAPSLADHLRSLLSPVANTINRNIIQPHLVQPIESAIMTPVHNVQNAIQHPAAYLHYGPAMRPLSPAAHQAMLTSAIQNVAMGAEGGLDAAALKDTAAAAGSAGKTAARGAVTIAKNAGELANDTLTHNPRPAPLTDSEVGNISQYRQTMGTPALDDATYQNARQSLAKVGINHTDTGAIDNLLGKFRTYDSRKVAAQGGYVKLPGGKASVPEVTAPAEKSVPVPSSARQPAKESQQLLPAPTQIPEISKPVSSADSTIKAEQGQAGQTKASRFTNVTVPKSNEVSAPLKAEVAKDPAMYEATSNKAHLAASDAYLQQQGVDKAAGDVMTRLSKPQGSIDHQTVSDAIATAKALDERATGSDLQTATDIYNSLAEHGSAAGQKIQALSLLSNRTPEGLRYSATKVLSDAKVPVEGKLAQSINSAVDRIKATAPGSDQHAIEIQKLVHLVNQNLPTGTANRLTSIWRAGLLTGPETVAKVTASHLINAPLELASRPISAAVDKATSLVTGKRAYTFNPQDYAEFGKGFTHGLDAAKQKLVHNVDLPNTGGFDEKFGSNTKQSLYEQYPGRVHGSIFKPNYAGAYRASLSDQARAAAINQGLPAAEHAKFIQDSINKPSDAAKVTANKEAEVFTNMQRSGLGTFASSVQKAKLGGVPIGKVIVPFTRIPTAIANKGIIDYTPLGLGKAFGEVVNGIKTGKFDQRAFSQTVGRSATGTTLAVAVGAKLASSGSVTLSAPADQKERALWDAQGKQPNSIKLGNKWVSLNAMGPYGIALGLGAAFEAALKSGQGPTNAGITALAAAGKLITDQPYFKGIAGMSNALNDPKRYATTFVDSTVGSVVPALSSQIANGTDTLKRTFGANIPDTLKSKVPGLRETLTPQRDLYGTPLPSGNGGSPAGDVIGSVNPFYPSAARNQSDPVTQELQRLYNVQGSSNAPNIAPPNKSQTVNGQPVKLTPQQLDSFIKTAGPTIQQGLTKLINSPVYKDLSDADKTSAVNKVINDAHQAASVQVLGNSPKNLSTGAAATLASASGSKTVTTAAATANKVALAKFKQSPDKTLTIGSTQYYKDPTGAVKSMPKAQYDYNQVSAKTSVGMEQAKTAGNLQAWMESASTQYTALEALKASYDPVTQADKIAGIQKQQDSLKAAASKYNGYGGFTKAAATKGVASTKGKVSTAGGKYQLFAYAKPAAYNKSLRSLLDAAKVSGKPRVKAA